MFGCLSYPLSLRGAHLLPGCRRYRIGEPDTETCAVWWKHQGLFFFFPPLNMKLHVQFGNGVTFAAKRFGTRVIFCIFFLPQVSQELISVHYAAAPLHRSLSNSTLYSTPFSSLSYSHTISRIPLTCPMSIVCRHRLLPHLESQPQVSGMHEGLRLGRRARALAHLRTSAAAWNFTSTPQAAAVRVAGLLCLRCSLFRVDTYECFARRLCLSGAVR